MKLIIIDRKAWERHHSEFADFIHRIEQLIGNPPEKDDCSTTKPYVADSASASVPCNHTEIREKSLSQ